MIYCSYLINTNSAAVTIKGGDYMTDSEKIDLLLSEMQGMKSDIQTLNQKVTGLEKDMVDVKSNLRRLHRDADFILDEVEKVHETLDKHKEDKSVHTA